MYPSCLTITLYLCNSPSLVTGSQQFFKLIAVFQYGPIRASALYYLYLPTQLLPVAIHLYLKWQPARARTLVKMELLHLRDCQGFLLYPLNWYLNQSSVFILLISLSQIMKKCPLSLHPLFYYDSPLWDSKSFQTLWQNRVVLKPTAIEYHQICQLEMRTGHTQPPNRKVWGGA